MANTMNPGEDRGLSQFRREYRREAVRRLAYVRAMDALPPEATSSGDAMVIGTTAADTDMGPKPSPRTILRWRRLFRASGDDIRSLVPRIRHGAGSNLPRWMVQDIHEAFMGVCPDTRPTMRSLVLLAAERIASHAETMGSDVRCPSYATIERVIRSSPIQFAGLRGGTAQRAFARSAYEGPLAGKGTIGIDVADLRHHLGAVGILTLCHDLASGRTLGAILGEGAEAVAALHAACGREVDPSVVTVIRRSACTPDRVVVDNAGEYHGRAFRDAAHGCGATIVFRAAPVGERSVVRLEREVGRHIASAGTPANAADYLSRWFDADDARLGGRTGRGTR